MNLPIRVPRIALAAALIVLPGLAAPREAFVVPSSHLDLWYLGPPGNSYARFERILSGALDLLDRQPDFRFTVENAFYLAQYVSTRPEMHGRLKGAFAGGRLDLSAQWCGLLQNPATAEDLVRNLLLASNFARNEFQFRPRAVIAEDMPGFTPQIAQLWRRSGVEGAMLTRGGPRDTSLFDWEAPDGSATRVAYAAGGYASAYYSGLTDSIAAAEGTQAVVSFHSVRNRKLEFQWGLAKYLKATFPGAGPAILGAGPDLSFPPSNLAPVVQEWNRRHGSETRVRIVTMPGLLDATRGDSHPKLSGDLQSVWQFASQAVERHVTLAHTSHALLVAEKIATLASLLTPMPYPEEALDRAWGWHIATVDHEGAALQDLSTRARQTAEEIQAQGAQMIADRVKTANRNAMVVAVLNPLPWSQRALVRIPLYLHGDIPSDATRWRQMVVRDENGKTVPARLRETPAHAMSKTAELSVVLDLPPLGYRALTLEPVGDQASADTVPWESPVSREVDPAQSAAISAPDGWQARFEPQTQSLLLLRSDKPVARIDVLEQSEKPAPVRWTTVKRVERWSESTLALEAGQGSQRNSLSLSLRDGGAPELAADAVFPSDSRARTVLRVSPAGWAPQSVVYGVPFGEMPFGSAVPGSGPTNKGDERPPELWRTLKEFDGWLRWDSAAGKVTMATEARGAKFSDTAVSFVLASQSAARSPWPELQHISLRSSFDLAPSERLMWELLEKPVVAVSEDRFGPASLPGSFSLLDWSAKDLVVTALRRVHSGAVILRTYAHSGRAVDARLTARIPFGSLTEVTPTEEPIGPGSATRHFLPWEIQTLRLEFQHR